jgi:alpha-L-rhamnosidase
VTIPANTEGIIHLPAQSVDDVTEQGQPLSQVESIREVQQANEEVIIKLGSGHYDFSTKR